ncbi:MAG: flagellar basal body-associated FliL family protein [Janthinobacterium lividum]
MSAEATVESRGGGNRKPIVMIGAVVVLLAAVGAGLWFSGVLTHLTHHGVKAGSAAIVEKPVFVDLPDVVSNLDTGGRRASFIKLHAKLQVAHAADVVALQAAIPQILDIFQTYLRSMRPEELRGGEGTYRLREALMNRIDIVLAPVQLTDMLFTEVLVQ